MYFLLIIKDWNKPRYILYILPCIVVLSSPVLALVFIHAIGLFRSTVNRRQIPHSTLPAIISLFIYAKFLSANQQVAPILLTILIGCFLVEHYISTESLSQNGMMVDKQWVKYR